MPDTRVANDFSINSLVINPVGNEPIDVRFQMIELNVHEDIWNTTMYGTLVLNDSLNNIKNLPIYGFETLDVSFNTPQKEAFEATFRIYKITDRFLEKERHMIYILHFVSEEMSLNLETRVTKSYKGKLISDIAKDIQENYLQSEFNEIEQSKFLHHVVIPNWYPMKAMNWLANRANAMSYAGANYVYYQNKLGYNFLPLERIVERSSTAKFLFQPANLRIPYFTDGDPKTRDESLDPIAVQSYKILDHINVLENIQTGMYGNTLTTHNFVRKIWRENTWEYGDTWLGYKHMEPNQNSNSITGKTGKSFLSDQGSSEDNPVSQLRVYTSEDGVPEQQYPNKVEQWMQSRISQIQQMKNIRIKCSIPGDSERTVGQMLEFFLPSPERYEGNQEKLDIYYQGKYMITALCHTIQTEQYITTVEITKDSVFSCYP